MENRKTEVEFGSKPAVSLRFAKLPDETESAEGREDNGFGVAEIEPYSDLNWSRLLEIGNPSFFCIAKIEMDLENVSEVFERFSSLPRYAARNDSVQTSECN